MQSFQCRSLYNVLFLNKRLHIFGTKSSPLCSFYNLYEEIPFHIFYECDHVKCLWSDLVQFFQNTLVLSTLRPQAAIFGILDSVSNNCFSVFAPNYFPRTIMLKNFIIIHFIFTLANFIIIHFIFTLASFIIVNNGFATIFVYIGVFFIATLIT